MQGLSHLKGAPEAARIYHSQLNASPAAEYLASRGIPAEVATGFGLGWCGSALTAHSRFRGRLVIPYLRPAGTGAVATVRFRCISDHVCKEVHGGKYLSLPGDRPRLFNTAALLRGTSFIVICEGEIDAITATMAGVPAVAVQGTSGWRDHFIPAFAGYDRVFVIADGDPAGREAARRIAEMLPSAAIVDLGDGLDVNSFVQQYGADAFIGRLELTAQERLDLAA